MSTNFVKSYAMSIDAKQFPYFDANSGELAPNVWYMVKNTVLDFFRYGIIHHWVNVNKITHK